LNGGGFLNVDIPIGVECIRLSWTSNIYAHYLTVLWIPCPLSALIMAENDPFKTGCNNRHDTQQPCILGNRVVWKAFLDSKKVSTSANVSQSESTIFYSKTKINCKLKNRLPQISTVFEQGACG
jgi:hypothetical protein